MAGGNNAPNTIPGTPGNDTLCGLGGDDTLRSGDGDDILLGGIGDDILLGGDGNDTLVGVNPLAIRPGFDEIDSLTGGSGGDLFVLGDANQAYYDDLGERDFAIITDLNLFEDSIQLHGNSPGYELQETVVILDSGDVVQGLGIYAIQESSGSNDLIGLIENSPIGLDLNDSVFNFV